MVPLCSAKEKSQKQSTWPMGSCPWEIGRVVAQADIILLAISHVLRNGTKYLPNYIPLLVTHKYFQNTNPSSNVTFRCDKEQITELLTGDFCSLFYLLNGSSVIKSTLRWDFHKLSNVFGGWGMGRYITQLGIFLTLSEDKDNPIGRVDGVCPKWVTFSQRPGHFHSPSSLSPTGLKCQSVCAPWDTQQIPNCFWISSIDEGFLPCSR